MSKSGGMTDNQFCVIILWIIASWLTHVVVCIKAASWGFLIAGAVFFPIAIVHGTGVWMGVW